MAPQCAPCLPPVHTDKAIPHSQYTSCWGHLTPRKGGEGGRSIDRNCAFCKQTIIASLKKLSFPISKIKHLKSPVKEGCDTCPPPQ